MVARAAHWCTSQLRIALSFSQSMAAALPRRLREGIRAGTTARALEPAYIWVHAALSLRPLREIGYRQPCRVTPPASKAAPLQTTAQWQPTERAGTLRPWPSYHPWCGPKLGVISAPCRSSGGLSLGSKAQMQSEPPGYATQRRLTLNRSAIRLAQLTTATAIRPGLSKRRHRFGLNFTDGRFEGLELQVF